MSIGDYDIGEVRIPLGYKVGISPTGSINVGDNVSLPERVSVTKIDNTSLLKRRAMFEVLVVGKASVVTLRVLDDSNEDLRINIGDHVTVNRNLVQILLKRQNDAESGV